MADGSLVRTQMRTGVPAWLASGYAQVKDLLHDDRLDVSHPSNPDAPGWEDRSATPRVFRNLARRPSVREAENPEQLFRAKFMNTVFSQRNIDLVRPGLERISRRLLDDTLANGRPVNFTVGFSIPFSYQAAAELLGLPVEAGSLDRFAKGRMRTTSHIRTDDNDIRPLIGDALRTIAQVRRSPGKFALGPLVGGERRAIADERRLVNLLAWVINQCTVEPSTLLDWGISLLALHPDQWRRAERRKPLLETAVQEIMRLYKTPAMVNGGLIRYAQQDFEVAGTSVKKGDLILLDIAAANRDHSIFERAESFASWRAPNPHLTFGLGRYMCKFRKFVATELSIALDLTTRVLPNLHLRDINSVACAETVLLSRRETDLTVEW